MSGVTGDGGGRTGGVEGGGLHQLTLQTINEQQLIILRQKELVATLKTRVEELEKGQQQWRAKRSDVTRNAGGEPVASAYAVEVQLRRQVKLLEEDKTVLQSTIATLQAELTNVLAEKKAYLQQYAKQAEEAAAMKLELHNTEAKRIAEAQLREASNARHRQLFNQIEKLQRENEIRSFECAQWRSLATTAIGHLDRANRRHAEDQVTLIQEEVRRFRKSRTEPWCNAHSPSCPTPGDTSAEFRKVWSRSAQVASPPSPPPPPRERVLLSATAPPSTLSVPPHRLSSSSSPEGRTSASQRRTSLPKRYLSRMNNGPLAMQRAGRVEEAAAAVAMVPVASVHAGQQGEDRCPDGAPYPSPFPSAHYLAASDDAAGDRVEGQRWPRRVPCPSGLCVQEVEPGYVTEVAPS